MQFKEWLKLQEVGTGTNAVAVFSRPMMGVVTRGDYDDLWLGGRPEKKRKKKKGQDEELPGLAD